MTSTVDHTGSTILSPFQSGQLPERRTVFQISSPTADVRNFLAGADESGVRPPMVWRPVWGLAVRPLHHIGASAVRRRHHGSGTSKWSGRSPRGRPPSAHPRGGWRRAGRCSQLLSDAKHPQHPRNGFWLGVSWAKSVEFSEVKIIWGCYTSYLGIHCAVVPSSCTGAAQRRFSCFAEARVTECLSILYR